MGWLLVRISIAFRLLFGCFATDLLCLFWGQILFGVAVGVVSLVVEILKLTGDK